MKQRLRLFKRGNVYYFEDTQTRKQQSLGTKDKREAGRLLQLKIEAVGNPGFNRMLLRACLSSNDPDLGARTWKTVMDQISMHGKPQTQKRYQVACGHSAFAGLQNKRLLETTAQDFLSILKSPQISVNHYLRRLHNLALGLGWLPAPVLAPKLWPKIRSKEKRSITIQEHQRILAAEKNVERRLFYQLLWEIGAAQSDGASLRADQIDWQDRTLSYQRMKTGEWSHLSIGADLEAILKQLPSEGPLFPKISGSTDNARAAEFSRRCRLLGIKSVTLHSYRYAWAERAKRAGYPERFAQQALGHNSKAIHRAYAKNAKVIVPALQTYEAAQESDRLCRTGVANFNKDAGAAN